MAKIINFSYNWNNKLNCKSFTTLRLSHKYSTGDKVEITLKNKFHCNAEIIDIKRFHLENINNYVAYLDTGYDEIECQNILKKMYKNKNIDWDNQNIYFILLKKIENTKDTR